jgi:hypothetical protein
MNDKKVLNGLIYYEELVSNLSLSAMVFVVGSFILHIGKNSLVVDLTNIWVITIAIFVILTTVDILKR